MSAENQPKLFKTPLEFSLEKTGRGTVIHSLGQMGVGPAKDHHVDYYPGRGKFYELRAHADQSLPAQIILPGDVIPSREHHEAYRRAGSRYGIFIRGFAAGEIVGTKFVHAARGVSLEARRERFQEALHEMNELVRERAMEDFGLNETGEEFPKAA